MASAPFKIEKSVPLPSMGGRKALYPFREMAVGDSFEVKLADSGLPSLHNLQNSLSACGRGALGRGSVTVRLNDTRDGFRVWRVA